MPKTKKTIEINYILSFIFRFSAIALTGFGIFGLFIITFLNKEIGPTYLKGISALDQIRTHLPPIISITAFAQAIMLCGITLLITLLWSYAIAGPLVRFKKHLKNIARGRLLNEPVFFRETDQLQALAKAFSEMIISHKENRAQALVLLIAAQKTLDEYETLQSRALENKTNQRELEAKLRELKKIYSRIRDIYAA